MNTTEGTDQRADRIAARATGFGAGLITFMLTWTVGARSTERFLDAPNSAYVAMSVALLAGTVATLWVGHRLVSSLSTTTAEPEHTHHAVAPREQATIG